MGDFYGMAIVLVAGVGVAFSLHGVMGPAGHFIASLAAVPGFLLGMTYVSRYGRSRACTECGAAVRSDWETAGDRLALKRLAYAIGMGAMAYFLIFGRMFL